MRRTSLTTKQAIELAQILRIRREILKLSMRQVAARSGVPSATIVRLEKGQILTPQPETLKAIAFVLQIPMVELLTVADWLPAGELPGFRVYLRSKYHDMPEAAVTEIEALIERLARENGLKGPVNREDEH
jgi:transcriptional regulator with XRE-family HTH domain